MIQHTTASVAFLTGITARERSEDVELLTTKLCAPPSRPLLVPRARLIARLDDSLRRGDRLMLVSAPAGSGKTTLLGTWLHRLSDAGAADRDGMPARAPIGAAWLTLDPADNEPARFWRYLIGALQTIDPGLGGDAQRLLVAPRRPLPRKLMSSLLNDLAACPKTVVLILDDYQTIAAATIHKGLTFLADHAPPQLQLVLSSRSDPPLPLVRFRARDQLGELRMAELHFTLEEAAAFLAAITGISWWPAVVQVLHDRTEGWIVGLRVAGLELRRLLAAARPADDSRRAIPQFIDSFSGQHSDIRNFIEDEVLTRQSQQVQAFLMVTSILSRLTGSLCDAVTGQTGSQALLEQLEKANLFLVPLDGARSWYRYQPMFADVLRYRLCQAPPYLAAMLHRRAAEWYAAHGYPADVTDHWQSAEQLDRAAVRDTRYRARGGAIAPPTEDGYLITRHAPPDSVIEAERAPPTMQMHDIGAQPPVPWISQEQLAEKEPGQLAPLVAWWPDGAPLVEQLTERELAILRLMADGLTYLQMSDRLVISLNTMRFHVKHIYGKLGVHSRARAIERAKELRLLPA